MKRTLTTCLAVFSLLLPLQPFAARGGEADPGDKAYEHASDKASFKRDDDRKQILDWDRDDDDDKDKKHQRDRDRDRDGPGSDKGRKSKPKKDSK